MYNKDTLLFLSKIKKDIESGDILYAEINSFYDENVIKKENILLSRLILIFLNQKEEAKQYLYKINHYYSNLKNVLKDLQIILDRFYNFF